MSDAPRLFLITPPVAAAALFAPLLEAAVTAADVACVLIRAAGRDDGENKQIVRTLAPIAQSRGAAVLVDLDPRLAARLDVDGVHVGLDSEGAEATLDEALAALRPRRIVGAGGPATRDAAMHAGEAGVDYVMFGGPDSDAADVVERAAWWAAIFTVPCVAYARHLNLVEELGRTGAEFVAVCDGLWEDPAAIAETMRRLAAALPALGEATS